MTIFGRTERWRLFLFNTRTGERAQALAKHAEMLSRYEANAIIRRSQGKMGEWVYRKEVVAP